jgi:fluoride ion exporter CrcB/FEX
MNSLFLTALRLLCISVGAMLGVLTRLLLGRAFDPEGLNIVSATSPLFVDLPANALGCFLAGAYTPFKSIVLRSQPALHHGFSTGYLGSLTSTPYAPNSFSLHLSIGSDEESSSLTAIFVTAVTNGRLAHTLCYCPRLSISLSLSCSFRVLEPASNSHARLGAMGAGTMGARTRNRGRYGLICARW